jgi:hypothetical protein
MMKTLLHISLTFFILVLAACESEEILSPDEVFVEYTVVQAEIQPNKYFPAVRITKTLPLGVPYRIEDAELKNITAYLVKNGIQVIPLLYTSEGLYKPRYEFYVEEGETYELFAERDGKFIYGKTTIPYKPEVTAVNYNTSDFFLDANVISKLDEVYGALWIISAFPPAQAEDFFTVTSPSSSTNNNIMVRTSPIPEEFQAPAYSESRYIQVYSFDKSFRDYFYSRTSGQEITDPFIQGGGNVEWNMQGDKVIGMFIGVTPGDIIRAN